MLGGKTRVFGENLDLLFLILPTMIYFAVFHYIPMFGIQLAFKQYRYSEGILFSPWLGLRHFHEFFNSYYFQLLIKNTLYLSFYSLFAGFPVPILLALSINQIRSRKIQKTIQTTVYAPHFVSTVVIVSIMFIFLSPKNGIINHIIMTLGGKPVFFMADSHWFRDLYVLSNIWQHAGFSTIVYLAALSSIDPNLYEAASIDGASKLQKIWHIDIPSILPTVVVLFILAAGRIMNIGFEKAYLMQTPMNLQSSEIIATYVYKIGLEQARYDFATAVGLFNSVINLTLLLTVNGISRKLNGSSLF